MEDTSIKLLLFAIVQEQDQESASRALEQLRVPIVHLASAGAFLGRRNITLLVGIQKGREADALRALEESCRQRVEYLTLSLEGSPLGLLRHLPVIVSGATVFTLPVEHFEEI